MSHTFLILLVVSACGSLSLHGQGVVEQYEAYMIKSIATRYFTDSYH
jgi:hypothetical protein